MKTTDRSTINISTQTNGLGWVTDQACWPGLLTGWVAPFVWLSLRIPMAVTSLIMGHHGTHWRPDSSAFPSPTLFHPIQLKSLSRSPSPITLTHMHFSIPWTLALWTHRGTPVSVLFWFLHRWSSLQNRISRPLDSTDLFHNRILPWLLSAVQMFVPTWDSAQGQQPPRAGHQAQCWAPALNRLKNPVKLY